MELNLSLGDTSFLEMEDLGFHLGLGSSFCGRPKETRDHSRGDREDKGKRSRDVVALQLHLFPSRSVSLLPQLNDNNGNSSDGLAEGKWLSSQLLATASVAKAEVVDAGAAQLSSPNSGASSFHQLEFRSGSGGRSKTVDALSFEGDNERACSKGSDEYDEDNGLARKKLRLSKEQSAFLEESFKEHHTLNPKEKTALAKQLHLRPRQVEVWFQNRRARTKLKQTEVDCEHLKRCCERLTEENKRLHKELQELRALKSSHHYVNPFMKHPVPATTLTMCPSCERVSTSTATATNTNKMSAPSSSLMSANPRTNLIHRPLSNNTQAQAAP
ncbi:homeobox-leucine zipper protein HOX11-like [Syzygium oleosum]|uniref:homeobox-leucine zipper protein HOX11-like n=1 Tax=Syzygium oleosum TaxID=219896 RepID=UPI0011D2B9D4|nr:homeobox-leucine zipper protein HOX11-like [Syzygium oleosum]